MNRYNNGQIEQHIYDALEEYFSGDVISGALYPEDCRPLNSHAEDAVIAVGSVSAEQVQEGRARLNIYVPDINNGTGRPVKDKTRLDELSLLDTTIVELLNDAETDYLFSLAQATQQLADEAIGQHFVNITLDFKLVTFNQDE